jgi:hypothetical protein
MQKKKRAPPVVSNRKTRRYRITQGKLPVLPDNGPKAPRAQGRIMTIILTVLLFLLLYKKDPIAQEIITKVIVAAITGLFLKHFGI